ncbi:MAG: leucine-rich repeat protein [Prevotellaceae bacterium]|jgi:hypothetical protein|nr:leucine-rich repeat protein [Prevotellaceae bacterium]
MKWWKKISLIISAACTSLALPSCAEKEPVALTGSITGTVTNFKTGNALSGVTVEIVANANTGFSRQTGQTGDDGNFSFGDIEASSYKVSFSQSGYADNSKDVTVPVGQTVTCDAVLTIHPDFEITSDVLTAYYGKGGRVVIPEGVTSIGRSVFQDNLSLTSVLIPEGVNAIGEEVFSGCNNLATATLPNTLRTVGEHAFAYCHALTSITIPDGVTTIDNWAFSLAGFTSVAIPGSVGSIGYLAFSGSTNLTSIAVSADNPSYLSDNGVLFNKAKTLLVQCPAGKQGNYAIPSGVTDVEIGAFYGCSGLYSISIPQSVARVGDYAFNLCTALTLMTVEWTNPINVSYNIFSNISIEKITLRVPSGTKAAYQAANVWKNFGTIIEY